MVERNRWPGPRSCLTPHTVRYQYVRILSSVHRWLHPQLPVLFCLVFISPGLQLQLFEEEAIDNKQPPHNWQQAQPIISDHVNSPILVLNPIPL